jgi:hypothetical protein
MNILFISYLHAQIWNIKPNYLLFLFIYLFYYLK